MRYLIMVALVAACAAAALRRDGAERVLAAAPAPRAAAAGGDDEFTIPFVDVVCPQAAGGAPNCPFIIQKKTTGFSKRFEARAFVFSCKDGLLNVAYSGGKKTFSGVVVKENSGIVAGKNGEVSIAFTSQESKSKKRAGGANMIVKGKEREGAGSREFSIWLQALHSWCASGKLNKNLASTLGGDAREKFKKAKNDKEANEQQREMEENKKKLDEEKQKKLELTNAAKKKQDDDAKKLEELTNAVAKGNEYMAKGKEYKNVVSQSEYFGKALQQFRSVIDPTSKSVSIFLLDVAGLFPIDSFGKYYKFLDVPKVEVKEPKAYQHIGLGIQYNVIDSWVNAELVNLVESNSNELPYSIKTMKKNDYETKEAFSRREEKAKEDWKAHVSALRNIAASNAKEKLMLAAAREFSSNDKVKRFASSADLSVMSVRALAGFFGAKARVLELEKKMQDEQTQQKQKS
jgi:hypothetical protein